jgi:hypothetical protein
VRRKDVPNGPREKSLPKSSPGKASSGCLATLSFDGVPQNFSANRTRVASNHRSVLLKLRIGRRPVRATMGPPQMREEMTVALTPLPRSLYLPSRSSSVLATVFDAFGAAYPRRQGPIVCTTGRWPRPAHQLRPQVSDITRSLSVDRRD